jgi:hypothetical protein
MWLDRGEVKRVGPTDEVLEAYSRVHADAE